MVTRGVHGGRLDTMHLASCYQGSEAEGGSQGCDISHRGGPPGFVQLQGEGTLFWADYIGNYTFTSLGAQLPKFSNQLSVYTTLHALVATVVTISLVEKPNNFKIFQTISEVQPYYRTSKLYLNRMNNASVVRPDLYSD